MQLVTVAHILVVLNSKLTFLLLFVCVFVYINIHKNTKI